jgi:folate-binding protein YgfZ
MTDHPLFQLAQRQVWRIEGAEAFSFLQALVPLDVPALPEGQLGFTALLTPQGKIRYDFYLLKQADSLLLDIDALVADTLIAALKRYSLRQKVQFSACPTVHVVLYPSTSSIGHQDPRSPALYRRDYVTAPSPQSLPDGTTAYTKARLQLGLFAATDAAEGSILPHEAGYDLQHLISFTKGCYIGQEMTARLQHRALLKRRVAAFALTSADTLKPQAGDLIKLEDGREAGEVICFDAASAIGLARRVIDLATLPPPAPYVWLDK